MQIQDLKLELTQAKDGLLPELEGLQDFSRLNILESSRTVITEAIAQAERRLSLLEKAISALNELLTNGYPSTPIAATTMEVAADLRGNLETLNAAFGKLSVTGEALTGHVVLSDGDTV